MSPVLLAGEADLSAGCSEGAVCVLELGRRGVGSRVGQRVISPLGSSGAGMALQSCLSGDKSARPLYPSIHKSLTQAPRRTCDLGQCRFLQLQQSPKESWQLKGHLLAARPAAGGIRLSEGDGTPQHPALIYELNFHNSLVKLVLLCPFYK